MNTTTACAGDGDPVRPYFPIVVRQVLRLTPRGCRWPLGDPLDLQFAFCGRPSVDRASYCAEHRRLACEALR